jgi:hypothetical protein
MKAIAILIAVLCSLTSANAQRLLKQSQTAQNLTFLMVLASDHVSPATGLSPTVTLSKAGASFGSPAGAVTEIGNGWYKVAGNATDSNSLGSLILHATGTAADPTDREYAVVAFDPQDAAALGLTNLDATVSSRLATSGYTTPPTVTAIRTEMDSNSTKLANLDATVSSRSTYAGADTSGTTTLLSRLTSGRATNLDNLDAAISSRSTYAGADTAGTTTLLTRLPSALTITSGKVDVNDKTGFSLAVAPPTAAAIRAEIDSNSTKLDVAVSTRSTYAGADTSGTTTLLSRLTSTRAGLLDNLDAAITSRSSHTAADVWAVTTRALTDKAGFSLTSAYDPAKTAAQPGDSMVASNERGTDNALLASSYTAPPSAAAIWSNGTRTLTAFGFSITTDNAAIADAVWDEALSGHSTAGTAGLALSAAGAAGDPWSIALPGSYATGTAGNIIGRFNIAPPTSPLIVLPNPPNDVTLCRVYGYIETLTNQPAANVTIVFKLIPKTQAKSERILSGRVLEVKTDAQGRITDGTNPYIDLQRNDNITPAGSTYLVSSPELGFKERSITLAGATFDLASAVP